MANAVTQRPHIVGVGFGDVDHDYFEVLFNNFQEVNELSHLELERRSCRRSSDNEVAPMPLEIDICELELCLFFFCEKLRYDRVPFPAPVWLKKSVICLEEKDFGSRLFGHSSYDVYELFDNLFGWVITTCFKSCLLSCPVDDDVTRTPIIHYKFFG